MEPSAPGPPGEEGPPAPAAGPPIFRHPQWMVGVVLVFGVASIAAGLADPVWFLIGSPFILALAVWIWVRFRR